MNPPIIIKVQSIRVNAFCLFFTLSASCGGCAGTIEIRSATCSCFFSAFNDGVGSDIGNEGFSEGPISDVVVDDST